MLDQFCDIAPETPAFVARVEAPIGRWAVCVRAVVCASEDLSTIGDWADFVNMGRSTLCGRCRAVNASAKDSLAFGRLARAVTLDDPLHWRPENDAVFAREGWPHIVLWPRAPDAWCPLRLAPLSTAGGRSDAARGDAQ